MSESGKILYFEHSPLPTAEETPEELSPLAVLDELARAMEDCGQDPATQLAGYLVTEDPTYLPDCNCARNLARRMSRDELLGAIIREYLNARDKEILS